MLQKTYEQNRYSRKFWEECEEYHDKVLEYYKGIEFTHPDRATSDGVMTCGANYCTYCAHNVTYIEHNGESI
jgi:hypothetical protein